MFKRSLSILFVFLFSSTSYISAFEMPPPEGKVIIHNRILAKVNGKTISVMDVVKKMDVFLNEHYPEYIHNEAAKYQFYSTQWKATLNQIIDGELIIADAEKMELKVGDAEVREKIHERFGPNVVKTLDKLGINYDEARHLVWTDMVVQRMNWFRVYSKVEQNINPKEVKEAYKDYSAKNPPLEEWEYEVLSIRSKDKASGESAASYAANMIAQTQAGLKATAEMIKNTEEYKEKIACQVSEVIKANDKNISEAHKKAILSLNPGEYSAPISQVSRINNELVERIYHLLSHKKKETPTFQAMADRLKDELVQKEAMTLSKQYIQKLRKRYGFDERHTENKIPDDFQPFSFAG